MSFIGLTRAFNGRLGWRSAGLMMGLLAVMGFLAVYGSAGAGVVGAQDDDTEEEFGVAFTSAPSKVKESEMGMFIVRGTGIGEDGVTLNYVVGPDDDSETVDITADDLDRVAPGGMLVVDEYRGTFTLTREVPEVTIVVDPDTNDGVDEAISEGFMVSVTGPGVDISANSRIAEGVCDRSISMMLWIRDDKVNRLLNDGPDIGCSDVTQQHLDAIMARSTYINLRHANPLVLGPYDFRGFEAATSIDLRYHWMTEIPGALWAGLANLERLQMDNRWDGNTCNPCSMPLTQKVRVIGGVEENTVRLEVVEHAPFEITATISATSGDLLDENGTVVETVSLTIPAGKRYSPSTPFTSGETGNMVTVSVDTASYPDDTSTVSI